MKCKVVFDNGNPEERFTSYGVLEYTDGGFNLTYAFDGDDCALCLNGDTLTQTRLGGAPITMAFAEGRQTQCTLGLDGAVGGFTLFTEKLRFEESDGGVKIRLAYKIGEADFTLCVAATAL